MSVILNLARIRFELRNLLVLAAPIMVGQLAVVAMGVVDTVMAGKVSPKDLAYVALGNSIWVPTLLLMSGILQVICPKVAHLFGAGQQEKVGALVRQAMYLALVFGILTASFLVFASEFILRALNVEEDLIAPTIGYLQGIALGFPAMGFYQVLRGTSEGLGVTRPNMIIAIIGLLANIPLNYILIFGKFGLPALGGIGCGWASGWVMWLTFILFFMWSRRDKSYSECNLYQKIELPNLAVIKNLLSIGVPIGVAVFAEVSIFSVIALLIGGLGAQIVAGHQITLNFSGLAFMVPYSLGVAITVRVGHALGRGAPNDAKFAAQLGIITALVYAFFSFSLMFFGRYQIAAFYSQDVMVINIAASLFIYAALYQFSDCLQVCLASALRGYQDTKVAMIIILVTYWLVALPLGYILGLTDFLTLKQGPAGLWQGLLIGLTLTAILLLVRFRQIIKKHNLP